MIPAGGPFIVRGRRVPHRRARVARDHERDHRLVRDRVTGRLIAGPQQLGAFILLARGDGYACFCATSTRPFGDGVIRRRWSRLTRPSSATSSRWRCVRFFRAAPARVGFARCHHAARRHGSYSASCYGSSRRELWRFTRDVGYASREAYALMTISSCRSRCRRRGFSSREAGVMIAAGRLSSLEIRPAITTD
jgi:hypothetical protein